MTPQKKLIDILEPLDFKDPYQVQFDCVKSLEFSTKKFRPEIMNFIQETSILIQMENELIQSWNKQTKSPLTIHFDAFLVNYKNEIKTITSILSEDEHCFFNYIMTSQKIEWTNNMFQSSLSCHEDLWNTLKNMDFGIRIIEKIDKPWSEIKNMSWRHFFQILKDERDHELKELHEMNSILQDGVAKVSALKLHSFEDIKKHLQILWLKQDFQSFFWDRCFKDQHLEFKNSFIDESWTDWEEFHDTCTLWTRQHQTTYQKSPICLSNVDVNWAHEIVLFNAVLHQEKNHLLWIQNKWPKIYSEIEKNLLSGLISNTENSTKDIKRL